ncbi:MAG: hypothetical protein Q4D51_00215 [Eubacteriales bacterium]|nr:hypothetical protein [Eubacteriales bacterium]
MCVLDVENRKKNRGSAVIEMTLLIPIIMGCIYLYMMFFLFFIQTAKEVESISEQIYVVEQNAKEKLPTKAKSNEKVMTVKQTIQNPLFQIEINMRKNQKDPLENIRRWQLVTSGI